MTIGADARTHRASVALQVLLTDALVNHAAHFVVDGDEFVKARATREAAIGTFTRVIQRRWGSRIHTENFALVLAGRVGDLGGIVEYAILERFCSVLSTMLQAGVAVPEALKTTTDAVSNVVFREQLDIAGQQMLEGAGFSQPLIETELFPGSARQMFKVGEETGTLDQQLGVAAEYFNRELEYRIKTFTTLFEPIMIIFVGAVVGFVAIALVSAMYGVLNGVEDGASPAVSTAIATVLRVPV